MREQPGVVDLARTRERTSWCIDEMQCTPYTGKLPTLSRNAGMKPLQQLQPGSSCENCQPESQTRPFTPCAYRNVFHIRLLTSMGRLGNSTREPDSLIPPFSDSGFSCT